MRSFWITMILVLCFLIGWTVYQGYTQSTVKAMDGNLAVAEQMALKENWEPAYRAIGRAFNQWSDYIEKTGFAVDKEFIFEIEDSFKRSQKYILAKDNSNSSGEIRSLQLLLEKMVVFQKPTFDNIF